MRILLQKELENIISSRYIISGAKRLEVIRAWGLWLLGALLRSEYWMTSCWEQGGLGLLWAYLLIVGKSLYETKRYAWIFRRPRPVLFRPCAPLLPQHLAPLRASAPRRFWYTYGSPRIVDRVQREQSGCCYITNRHEPRKPKPKVMDIDVRNLALLVHTFSRRFELSFSFWFFSAATAMLVQQPCLLAYCSL